MATLFTKIIKGEIPSYKLYEDQWVYAFLDIRPIHRGHSLIIPKTEVDYFADVPSPEYEKCFLKAQDLSRAIKKATGCRRVGLVVAGYEVPHFHLHMIPTWGLEDFDFNKAQQTTPVELSEMQTKILSHC